VFYESTSYQNIQYRWPLCSFKTLYAARTSRQTEIDGLIDGEYYFILHAPRQSGKTTYLQFLTNEINAE
jgi:predicted AAA+ superfamily ATPase